jgi:hypothetical protein
VIGRDGFVLDEHIETTMFSHRKATDVIAMLEALKGQL